MGWVDGAGALRMVGMVVGGVRNEADVAKEGLLEAVVGHVWKKRNAGGGGGEGERRMNCERVSARGREGNMRRRHTRLVRVGHDFIIGNLVCAEDHGGLVGVLICLGRIWLIKAVMSLWMEGRVGRMDV